MKRLRSCHAPLPPWRWYFGTSISRDRTWASKTLPITCSLHKWTTFPSLWKIPLNISNFMIWQFNEVWQFGWKAKELETRPFKSIVLWNRRGRCLSWLYSKEELRSWQRAISCRYSWIFPALRRQVRELRDLVHSNELKNKYFHQHDS